VTLLLAVYISLIRRRHYSRILSGLWYRAV